MTQGNSSRPVPKPPVPIAQDAAQERVAPEIWEREQAADARAMPSPFKPAVPTPVPPPMCRKDGTSV